MDYLPRLIAQYARHKGLAVTTASRMAGGRYDICDRAASGRITLGRAARIVQWLSDHWPEGAEWPPDIPRPVPTPERPAA